MYRSLLVPLDGSIVRRAGAPDWPQKSPAVPGAVLHIVLVHNSIAVVPGRENPWCSILPLMKRCVDRRRITSAAVSASLATAAVVRDDRTARWTHRTDHRGSCTNHAIDLVVLTTHGRGCAQPLLDRERRGPAGAAARATDSAGAAAVRRAGAPSPAMIRRDHRYRSTGRRSLRPWWNRLTQFAGLLGADFTLFRAVVVPPPVWLPVPGCHVLPEDDSGNVQEAGAGGDDATCTSRRSRSALVDWLSIPRSRSRPTRWPPSRRMPSAMAPT